MAINEEEQMFIVLADHGRSFSTRARAEQIAASLDLDDSGTVLDLSDVKQVSGSFVDELLYRVGGRVRVVGAMAAEVERVVALVADRRGVTLDGDAPPVAGV